MGDVGDDYRAWTKSKQDKKAANRESSPLLLEQAGFDFESKNMGAHLIVTITKNQKADFWPGTGLFNIRKVREGRGVRNLIHFAEEIRKNEQN